MSKKTPLQTNLLHKNSSIDGCPNSIFKPGILFLITLFFLLSSKGNEHTLEIASELAQQAVESSLALEIATDLTTGIGPRLYGSESEKRAVEWARARFEEYGFDNIWSEPFTVDRGWERGLETASITHPAPQNLVITALGGSVPTPEGGIEAEVVVFKTIQALLDQPESSLDGKNAVVTQAMEIGGYGRFSGPIRQNGPSEAAKRGATAYLMRSAGTDNDRMAHTGGTSYEPGVRRIPAAALSVPDAQQIDRLEDRQKSIRIKLLLTPKELGTVTSHNLIAEINGSESDYREGTNSRRSDQFAGSTIPFSLRKHFLFCQSGATFTDSFRSTNLPRSTLSFSLALLMTRFTICPFSPMTIAF